MAGSDDERIRRAAEEQAQRNANERARCEAAEAAERARLLALANTRATLHAQAVAVQSIKALVPIVLDVNSDNYSKWSNLILNTLGKYALDDHVFSDDDRPKDEDWIRLDFTVKSWLYGTISPDLYELVMNRTSTARSVWLGLEQQFLGNKESRALYLDAAFRNFVQGDMSVSDYCRKLKGMADALGDLGEPVLDRTLVLNVLRGLNDKFAYMVPLLKRQRPFPSFIEVRADLLLEEITMTNRSSSSAAASAFVAGTHSSVSSVSSGSSSSAPRGLAAGSSGAGSRRNRRNRRRNDGSSSQAGGNTGWPTIYNPWTGSFQVWVGPSQPRQASGHNSRIGPQHQARGLQHQARGPQQAGPPQGLVASALPAGFTPGYMGLPPPSLGGGFTPGGLPAGFTPGHMGVPLVPGTPGALPTPLYGGWDQQQLANSFDTMTLTPPASTDWYFDSGATSHMSSDTGSQLQERDRQVQ